MPGMQSIIELKTKVVNVNKSLTDNVYLKQIILNNEAFIVNMNTEFQLMDKGENALGVSISDYMPYAEYTIEVKKAKGQPYDRVTLHDEGDFAASFYIDIGDDIFEIKAGDIKTHDLIKKYGRQIMGLNDENIRSLIWEYIYPELLELVVYELDARH